MDEFPIDFDGDGIVDGTGQIWDTDGDGQPDAMLVFEDMDGDGFSDLTMVEEDFSPEHTNLVPSLEDVCTDYEHFDQSTASLDVIGDPDADIQHWHQQTYDDTCAVAAQEFILDSVYEGVRDFTEDSLRQEAIENGWYIPGAGTPMEHMGSLLEAHGVAVEREYGATLEELSNKLAQHQKVLVCVDADEIWMPGEHADDALGDYRGIPGQDSNHAVEVTGIQLSDSGSPMVILNDPGTPDGRGMMVPADRFVDAWADSNYFMVSTTGERMEPTVTHVASGAGSFIGAIDRWGSEYWPSSGAYIEHDH